MIHHGQLYQRDIVPPRSRYYDQGKFGRLFPTLEPFARDTPDVRQELLNLGRPGGPLDAQDPPGQEPNPRSPDNRRIPAGFTFLGQFIDHDLTFDPTSSLERQSDPESIQNFRTPTLELDSVYASGRAASPHLYDVRADQGGPRVKFLIEKLDPNNAGSRDDLPRNSQQTALIGDPRNDENVIVSQLHLAFLTFHNAVVDRLLRQSPPPVDVFTEAQKLVRWHYQWLVVHEFLPHIVGQELVDDILDVDGTDGGGGRQAAGGRGAGRARRRGRQFYDWNNAPFIPVEFSVAAYRFGHSQVRPGYRVNAQFAAPIFAANRNDLSGGRRAPNRFVEWPNFFDVQGQPARQPSRRIDTILSTPLFALPFTGPNLPGNPASLAQRNLLRHLTFSLPSGQDVAQAMHVTDPLDARELADLAPFERSTPLWLYILREAHLRANGERLGPVGGRIVAEVVIGVLEGDRQSYLRQAPGWEPTLGPRRGQFGIVDLLTVAGSV